MTIDEHLENELQRAMQGTVVPAYIKEKQAATYLNMSVNWLRKCRANGTGPGFAKFGSSVRYPITELVIYLEKTSRGFTGQT